MKSARMVTANIPSAVWFSSDSESLPGRMPWHVESALGLRFGGPSWAAGLFFLPNTAIEVSGVEAWWTVNAATDCDAPDSIDCGCRLAEPGWLRGLPARFGSPGLTGRVEDCLLGLLRRCILLRLDGTMIVRALQGRCERILKTIQIVVEVRFDKFDSPCLPVWYVRLAQ